MRRPPAEGEPGDYEVVYRDRHLIVVNKPANLLSVPGRLPENKDCLISRMLKPYPNSRVVHRLDMATSGLLLVPQTQSALSHLARQFQERRINKIYYAVVDGIVAQNSGEINQPLACDWPNRPKQHVIADGKPSITAYTVLQRNIEHNFTRIALYPITGRSHQLRVHLEYLGHPILGDSLYGTENSRSRANRLLLHAQSITFCHPVSDVQVSLTARGFHWFPEVQ